jgi:hypothetical protein
MAATVTKQVALDRLEACVEAMSGLEEAGWESPQFIRWQKDAVALVRRVLADEPDRIKQLEWRLSGMHLVPYGSDMAPEEGFSDNLVEMRETLASMRDEVRLYWPDGPEAGVTVADAERAARPGSLKVFVVHGHDGGLKETVARFLEKLGLVPIILHETPDEGRHILTKLLQESEEVAFAVVLLTPDDEGRAQQVGQLRARARQNVIFELGYLIGKLGSKRVKALYPAGGDFELPSDYDGVLYTAIDAGGAWKLGLCREMKAAGLDVDLNLAV